MIFNKRKMEVKRKIDVIGTLREIPVGESVTFKSSEFCSYAVAMNAVARLNGHYCEERNKRYLHRSDDNGVTFTISRVLE